MISSDPILRGFLEAQFRAAMTLAEESDILELAPFPPFPPQQYLARFKCPSLAGSSAATLRQVSEVVVAIRFPADYLRSEVNAAEIIQIQNPVDLWHSNVHPQLRLVCIGHWAPGTSLTDLLHQLYEIFTYQKLNTVDGLNPLAMEWALHHSNELPLDRRPLRRRRNPQPPVEVS